MNIFWIPTSDLFLLGVLSSNVSRFFLQGITGVKSGGFLVLKTLYVSQLPIPETPQDLKAEIELIVNALLHNSSTQEELALALGAAAFIRKPISRHDLLAALDRLLDLLQREFR